MGTRLDHLVGKAINTRVLLAAVNPHAKMSARAWCDRAMRNAALTVEQAEALELELTKPEHEIAAAFVNRLARSVVANDSYGSPPDNGMKLLRAYGNETTDAGLRGLDMSPLAALALASRQVQRTKPSRFGVARDPKTAQRRHRELLDELETFFNQMRDDCALRDLVFDKLPTSERDRGHVVARFKRYPTVTLADPDWPRKLVEYAEAKRRQEKAA